MNRDTLIDIAIIGGGCAGLMCGCLTAIESKGSLNIVIFEKNNKTGRKLLATGNGRCNLSNTGISHEMYNKNSQVQLKSLGNLLSFEFTQKVFKDLGLLIKTDSNGRAYPKSGNASSVLDVLRNTLVQNNVQECSGVRIRTITKNQDYFTVATDSEVYKTKNIILSCGGCASSVFGTNGDGFKLAKSIGHTIVTPYPSLAPIPVKEKIRELKGVRAECNITLKDKDVIIASESGELQINEDNISGICVFNLSEVINRAFVKGISPPIIEIDFLPDIKLKDLSTFVIMNSYNKPKISIDNILSGVINKKLAAFIIKKSLGISPATYCKQIDKNNLSKICNTIKHFTLTAKEMSDFKKAQVSCGGVSTKEINFNTMSSRIVDGLFFAGEIVDVNAPCGGFNLQWAWTSAAIAAKSAVQRCIND